jgi:hypothetical protein
MKGLLALPLVLVTAHIVRAQTAHVTPLPSKLITIASYDDKLHFWTFPGGIRDSTIKPFAIVVTNSTDREVIAANVVWSWIGVDQKPHSLVQEDHKVVAPYGVVSAKWMSLILPNGLVIPKGGSVPHTGVFSRPWRSSAATEIHVALDAVVLSDGQVIGPDKNHLITRLQGEAEAAAKMKTIINAAKAQGRDPQPDIEKAIADEPRSSATGGWLVWFMHDSKLGGGRWQVPPQMELPHFYRK